MILHLALLVLLVVFGFASPLRLSAQTDASPDSDRRDLRAEEGTLEILKEEETVVTASRHAQRISEAPSNVYVITDDDIRQSGAIDLPTVLRRLPGLEVMQMLASEFNASARGNNQTVANKLLVLIDGYERLTGRPNGVVLHNRHNTTRAERLWTPRVLPNGPNMFTYSALMIGPLYLWTG